MTTRSAVLWALPTDVNTVETLFTVPANTIVILKSIGLYNAGADPAGGVIALYSSLGGVNVYLMVETVESNRGAWWNGWVVMEPGDQVWISWSGTAARTWGSGALLPLRPA